MPPRTFRDLTEEELAELEADLAPRAAVPRLPVGGSAAAPPYRVEIGDIQMLGEDGDEAWLDELIARPQAAPAQQPMLSAAGPGGTFAGQDTPEARALVKQRGMQVTSAPSDDELLDALASERTAAMPELDGGDDIDALIADESADMDREQATEAAYAAAPPRQTREDALRELLQPPSRMQGIAALIGDAFLGGDRVSQVQQRQRGYESSLANARMQDIQAGEKADERGAQRALADARLGVTLRGQDLADARAEEARQQQRELFERTDQRIREEGARSREEAMKRALVAAEARARGEAPPLTPDQERAGLAGYLSEQANTSEAEASAYLAGKTEGLAPGKIERLRATDSQLKMLPPAQRGTVIAQGLGRSGADRDRKEPAKLESRTQLLEMHRVIDEASKAWKNMSEKDRRVMASVGGGDSWLASTARDAGLSEKGQVQAAAIQALADLKIKLQSGANVPAGEWRRIATELGLPKDPVSPFNSPSSIDAWLKQSRDAFRMTRDSTLKTYPDLFDDMEAP